MRQHTVIIAAYLAGLVRSHGSPQIPIPAQDSHESRTFIDSSIFRPRDKISSQSSGPRAPLVPSYRPQDYSDAAPTFVDMPTSIPGIETFAHLNFTNCYAPQSNGTFDIAIVGAPFDLGVSYRPGARFGTSGIRQGSQRMSPHGGWSMDHLTNPFQDWATVTDCGDIDNTPFDKLIALQELEDGWKAINAQSPKNTDVADAVRIISLGGDHTITLPIIRALHSTWGPVAVLHFDSHLDTWDPKQLGGGVTKYASVNHGTMLHIAHEEGLLANNSNMHLGSRCALLDQHYDLDNDARCGFSYIRARELDKLGVDEVVKRIVDRVGDELVYLSIDIDVLDPAFAPATGTIEPGGWTTRELLDILYGLSQAGVKIIGADVVEFTPVYDNAAETTAIAIAQIVYEVLQWMIHVPVMRP